jgi:hypothetical protein
MQPRFLASMLLAAHASAASAQDVEVTGAQVVLQPKTIPFQIVTIENRRSSPLVAWEIGLAWPGTGAGSMTHTADSSGRPEGAGSSAIQPNERREIELEPQDQQAQGSPTVKLMLAVFEDGYVEGLPEAVGRWRKKQQARVEEAAYWVRAFDAMPEYSEDAAKQHLAARAAEHASRASQEPSAIGDRLSTVLREPPQAPGRLFATLESIRRDAQARYAAVAPRARTAPKLEAGAPVVISSRQATLTDFVASVKNLRNVPIEAIGLEFIEPGATRPTSGRMSDYCTVPAVSPTGRIAPGEAREFRLNRQYRDGSRLPTVRISVVLFDDLTFEGSAARRDELWRTRERQAEEVTFAMAVRTEAAKKRDEDVLAFLIARRADRAKDLHAQGRARNLHVLDRLIEAARISPERVRDAAALERLEVERRALLRHVRR